MNKKKRNDLTKFYIIIGFAIVIIIGYFLYSKYLDNYNYLKIDKTKNLVYTKSKEQFGNYYQYRPMVNLKDSIGEVINNDIDGYLDTFNKDNVCITYEYDLSGRILSLVLKVEDYSYVESANVLSFRSYNINLGTLEILSNDKVIDLFELNSEDIAISLNSKLNDYYNYLLDNNMIDNKCNYDCFMKSRNYTEGLDDVEYYIRDGKLVLFKPHINISSTDEKENLYDFEITN